MWRTLIAICTIAPILGGTYALQAAPRQGPCAEIFAACQQAGFVRGGGKSGEGLLVDCVAPIMQEKPQPRRASKPLPPIDPQLVASCKASDPTFGQRGRQAPPAAEPPAAEPQAAPPRAGASPVPPTANAEAVAPPTSTTGKRPNIVFILTDDLSWNLIQYMPHVLAMQKQGVTFSNYFVTDSLCCPSRSSIFTGRYPHNTGIYRNTGEDGGYLGFHERGHERSTFAMALSGAGYRTAMLGKYLNGYEPADDPAPPGWTMWGVAGGGGYREFRYVLNQDGKVVRYGDEPTAYLTDVLSGLASGFVKQAPGTPFVIEIATFAPHAPYIPAPRDADALPGLQAPRGPAFNAAPDADTPSWLRTHRPLSDADVAKIDRDFRKRAQSVLAVDKMIGELQAAVAAIGEADNTYFVFSSDNGYHMGEHRLMPGKMTAFDTDIRVPLIITGPGIPAGLTVDDIAENVDLNPTFAELGGGAASADVDGRSLVPLLHGQKVPDWRTAALVEHRGPVRNVADPDLPGRGSGNPTTYQALRSRDSLYVEYANGEKEYHALAADPDELHNSYASLPSEQKASLHAMLEAMSACHGAQACQAAGQPPRSLTQR
jgi:N-acetylglucosamine-6-sulfatase